jgi:hypothetical protein
LLGVLLAAGPEEVFAALPLFALLVALVFRLYPGERLIARLAERFRPRRPRATSTAPPTCGAVLRTRPALAVLATVRSLRGPPPLLSHSI